MKAGGRKGRINMIAGYRDGKLIAPFTIQGACNRLVFETWLETCLISEINPGNLVVIDNASFHRGGRIEALIETAGCQMMYLSSYSPDLNRIETCRAWIKSQFRKLLRDFYDLREAIDTVLEQAMS